MDNKLVNKTIRRRRSECNWKKSIKEEDSIEYYPPGPIEITPSWNPTNRKEKPPYSYATIIGHAILSSKDRKLSLHDIYVWITEKYPFYSNDTQGWQNSIRHNLSLHKSFVKIDRDQTQTPPRKGCLWTIQPGKEKSFVDNLQKPVNHVRKQHSLSHFVSGTRRQQNSRSSKKNELNFSTIKENTSNSSSASSTSSSSSSNSSNHSTTSELEPIHISSSPGHQSNTSSLTSSPTFELLVNVPETSTSYNVYPEQAVELFGEEQNSIYNSSNNSMISLSHPSSLFSATSSLMDSNYLTDHHNEPYNNDTLPTSILYNNKYDDINIDNNMMIEDWAASNPDDSTYLPSPYNNYYSSYYIKPSSLYN